MSAKTYLSAVGFFVSWAVYGVIQEHVFKTRRFQYRVIATLIHQFLLMAFSLLVYVAEKGAHGTSLTERFRTAWSTFRNAAHKPWREYAAVGMCVVILRGTINFGLKYIDFNTKTVFQSARPIPVMISGRLFGSKFDATDYLVTALLCCGLYAFTQGDAQTSTDFNLTGVALMTLSVCADAVRLNFSERVTQTHLRSVGELLFCSELFGLALITPIVSFSGELVPAVSHFIANPDMLLLFIAMGTCAFFGSLSMTTFVKLSSAYSMSLLGIAQMTFSIAFSIVQYSKAIRVWHVIGGVLFVCGLVVRTQTQRRRAAAAAAKTI